MASWTEAGNTSRVSPSKSDITQRVRSLAANEAAAFAAVLPATISTDPMSVARHDHSSRGKSWRADRQMILPLLVMNRNPGLEMFPFLFQWLREARHTSRQRSTLVVCRATQSQSWLERILESLLWQSYDSHGHHNPGGRDTRHREWVRTNPIQNVRRSRPVGFLRRHEVGNTRH